MTETVQTTELAQKINAQIHAFLMILVERMLNARPHLIDQFVAVQVDGQEILTLNATNVGLELQKQAKRKTVFSIFLP